MLGLFRNGEKSARNEAGLNRNVRTAIGENIQIALTLAYIECDAYRWIYQGSAEHG
jgi:hypothetical protein